jgi:catechol 2,3-dioxygenase
MPADQPTAEALRFTRLFYRASKPDCLRHFYYETLGVPEGSLEFEGGASPRNPLSAGLFHTAFVVPDRNALGRVYLNLRGADVPVEGASDHVVSEAIYLQDPEGNGVEIYWDKPGDHWDKTTGHVTMGTYPLDLEALVEEVPGEIPRLVEQQPESPIQRIGHVHLRALSLKESESFWRSIGLGVTSRYAQIASFLAAGRYHHHIGINRFADWTTPLERAPGLAAMEIELTATATSAGNVERYQTTPENIDLITNVVINPVESR